MSGIGNAPTNFVNQAFRIAREVTRMADGLDDIADALEFVGLERLAGKLYKVGAVLRGDSEQLRDLVSDKVSKDAKESEQATANMVKVALVIGDLRAENEFAQAQNSTEPKP